MEKEILKGLPFWENLTDKEKALCEVSATENEYRAGSYLLGDGCSKSCLGMILVISGELRAFILSDEGREITLFRLGAGECCVLSASCVLSQITFETQLCVTKTARLAVIPSGTFGKLMESNIHVRCYAYELATERFSSVMWVMQQIIFYGFDRRLAHFFISEYRKNGSTEIHMTQEKIAEATNSSREVVARMIRQFAADGLVENRRGIILLKDIPGLEILM